MARVCVLGQRHPQLDKVMVRGVFTQRKKLWAALETIMAPLKLTDMTLYDDVAKTDVAASYSALCMRLTKAGRVTIADAEGRKTFLVCESMMNEVREWDADEAGVLKYNPVLRGGEDETE